MIPPAAPADLCAAHAAGLRSVPHMMEDTFMLKNAIYKKKIGRHYWRQNLGAQAQIQLEGLGTSGHKLSQVATSWLLTLKGSLEKTDIVTFWAAGQLKTSFDWSE